VSELQSEVAPTATVMTFREVKMTAEDYRIASDKIEAQRTQDYANLDEKFIKENYGYSIGDKITIPATAFNNDDGIPIVFELKKVHILSSNKSDKMKIALRGQKLSKNGKKVLDKKCYHELSLEMDKGISCFNRLSDFMNKDHPGITLLPLKKTIKKIDSKPQPKKNLQKSVNTATPSKTEDCKALKCKKCGNYKSNYSNEDQRYWCSMFNFKFGNKGLKV